MTTRFLVALVCLAVVGGLLVGWGTPKLGLELGKRYIFQCSGKEDMIGGVVTAVGSDSWAYLDMHGRKACVNLDNTFIIIGPLEP